MKEKGISFSTPMVRALLDGKKTQDRRIVQLTDSGLVTNGRLRLHPHDINAWMCCPYGRIGDRLWVKENYVDMTETHGQPWEKYNEETGLYERGVRQFIWYKADGDQPDVGDGRVNRYPWKPSIFMPRKLSRITLEITGVRVERLRDISEEGARAEGIADDGGCLNCGEPEPCQCPAPNPSARESFINSWLDFWDANPWVWCLSFKKV